MGFLGHPLFNLKHQAGQVLPCCRRLSWELFSSLRQAVPSVQLAQDTGGGPSCLRSSSHGPSCFGSTIDKRQGPLRRFLLPHKGKMRKAGGLPYELSLHAGNFPRFRESPPDEFDVATFKRPTRKKGFAMSTWTSDCKPLLLGFSLFAHWQSLDSAGCFFL